MQRHPPPTSTPCAAWAVLCCALLGAAAPAQAQGVAWVTSEKDNALTLVDLKSGTVTGTVPTCKRPRHLQRTPDGKQLLVACGDSHQADIIDLATRTHHYLALLATRVANDALAALGFYQAMATKAADHQAALVLGGRAAAVLRCRAHQAASIASICAAQSRSVCEMPPTSWVLKRTTQRL